MATDYLACPIADLLESKSLAINDGYRAKNSELADHGIPFARAGNIDGGFDFSDADRVPDETLSRVGMKVSEPGDVVFTSKGTVGRFAFVRDDTPRFVYSPQLCFWRVLDREKLCPHWLYYWMNSREFFLQFKGVAGQTDMAEYVSLRDQRAMRITLPPLPEQKRIAHVLSTLDDKIDLNRRMNATLEAMSRAIFKSWFVDFDPVRQKAAGKQPVGMDAQTAALFPDSFEDSEIGEVPKGWRVLALPEVADIMSGGTPRKSDAAFWGGDIPWVSPKVMTHIHVDDSIDRVTQAAVGNGTRLVPAGAVLVMVRGMGLHNGVRVSQANCPVTFNQDVKALVATGIPATHLLYWMLHEASSLLTKVQTSGHGTGVLPTDYLTKLMTVIPGSNDEVNGLVAYLEGLDAQLVSLATQEKTLAALRDALLPKLLSGEVRVSEAEGMVEEAVV
jgi:type I restriction enzyme S subunit